MLFKVGRSGPCGLHRWLRRTTSFLKPWPNLHVHRELSKFIFWFASKLGCLTNSSCWGIEVHLQCWLRHPTARYKSKLWCFLKQEQLQLNNFLRRHQQKQYKCLNFQECSQLLRLRMLCCLVESLQMTHLNHHNF